MLVNGVECNDHAHAIAANDRGLNYGDGLFETVLMKNGTACLIDAHLERLKHGCERLGIQFPGNESLLADLSRFDSMPDGVMKIIVTRGAGGRGYRPLRDAAPTRVVSWHEMPLAGATEIRARWCAMRLARNPLLAGIKHLNRLEQVLAQREWDDPQIHEGFMLDSEGELICGTTTNIFVVRSGTLVTSDLRYSGVRGVMRGAVMQKASRLGVPVSEEPLWPHDLETATEVFVTNAVRGVRAVVELDTLSWSRGPITRSLSRALES
jgi:4-amino-4-deoxychorismate lyase